MCGIIVGPPPKTAWSVLEERAKAAEVAFE
jgi:hypothetical protein